jgi:hypothetical protein
MENRLLVKKVLDYLAAIGWTELIEARYERQVLKDIIEEFPKIDADTLNCVLDKVLVK